MRSKISNLIGTNNGSNKNNSTSVKSVTQDKRIVFALIGGFLNGINNIS